MPTLSAFADEAASDLTQQIDFLTSLDIASIELRFVDGRNILDLSKDQLAHAGSLLRDKGIAVSAIGSPVGKIRLDEPFEPHLDKFKRAVDIALEFETALVRVFSYYPAEGQRTEDVKKQVEDRLFRQLDCLRDVPVAMVHENEAGIYGCTAERCVELAQLLNSEKFRLAYDPGNFVWGQKVTNNIETCWPLMKPYVAHIHVKDWALNHSVASMPGTGDAQIPELMNALAAMRYQGVLTMEPHLEVGGQFGGKTSPALYAQAVDAVRQLAASAGLELQ